MTRTRRYSCRIPTLFHVEHARVRSPAGARFLDRETLGSLLPMKSTPARVSDRRQFDTLQPDAPPDLALTLTSGQPQSATDPRAAASDFRPVRRHTLPRLGARRCGRDEFSEVSAELAEALGEPFALCGQHRTALVGFAAIARP